MQLEKGKKENNEIKQSIKKFIKNNETIIVSIIIRTMEIGNNSESTQYREKSNKYQWF